MSEIVAEGIIDAGTLQQYIDSLTPLVSEARIHWNEDGLSANVVDPANVAMIVPSHLEYRAFESYDAPGSATIGLALDRLDDRLDPASPDQLVQLQVDMETRRLNVDFGRAHQELGLIEPDAIRKEPDVSKLDLPNVVTIEGGELTDALKVVDMVSDHVVVSGDPDGDPLRLFGQADTDESEVSFTRADCIDADIGTACESVFSLEYLMELTTAIPDDAEVVVRYGDEFPIRVDWEASDGWLTVESVLAPRIQSQ